MFTSKKLVGSDESDIKVLMTRIGNCNAILEDDKENSNSYYVKAGALIELSELTNDGVKKQNYIQDALNNYDMAVKFNSKNSLYIIDRAKCHIILGQYDLAQIDMTDASKLVPTGMMGNHIRTQIEQVQKQLENTKEQVNINQSSRKFF